ncbi:hypothetical protein BMS3Abin16_00926 [archaeon BMS3Abin16]|nr:hypothetical protein BMS3Abin16_00926 [archaeon BMS3Abin16]
MVGLDSLEAFIKAKLNLTLNIKLFSDNHIHVENNDNSEKIEYDEGTKTVSFNTKNLSQPEKEELGRLLKIAFEKHNKLLLEEKSEETIQNLRLEESSEESISVLSYFKDIIPPEDYESLRASLYVDSVFKKSVAEGELSGDKIYHLKGDIIKKHGTRGLNICKIYGAGYFDTMIRPLHELIGKVPDFTKEKFDERSNIIIKESAFAVFVQGQWSVYRVEAEIKEKIKINLGYGIRFVNIHGIGDDLVEKIKRVIPNIENAYPNIEKTLEESVGIIFVKLRFP